MLKVFAVVIHYLYSYNITHEQISDFEIPWKNRSFFIFLLKVLNNLGGGIKYTRKLISNFLLIYSKTDTNLYTGYIATFIELISDLYMNVQSIWKLPLKIIGLKN